MARTTRRLDRNDLSLLIVGIVGFALVVTAFLTPWWTRGFTVDYDEDEGSPRPSFLAGVEGIYWSYGPFQTPGSNTVSSDGERAFATALIGITALLSALFIKLCLVLSFLKRTGRVEVDDNIPVRLGMTAFLFGLGAILITAFILPVAGPNPGWLYGDETETSSDFEAQLGTSEVVDHGRFANVGFFAGILAFVAYPAYLWATAANQRAEALAPADRRARANEPNY